MPPYYLLGLVCQPLAPSFIRHMSCAIYISCICIIYVVFIILVSSFICVSLSLAWTSALVFVHFVILSTDRIYRAYVSSVLDRKLGL